MLQLIKSKVLLALSIVAAAFLVFLHLIYAYDVQSTLLGVILNLVTIPMTLLPFGLVIISVVKMFKGTTREILLAALSAFISAGCVAYTVYSFM